MRFSKYVFVFVGLFFWGCMDEGVDSLPLKQFNLTVDGVTVKVPESAIVANENCESIFLSLDYLDSQRKEYKLRLTLTKDGYLQEVHFIGSDYAINSSRPKMYWPQTFSPASTFEIKNFSYNHQLGTLVFGFEGKLFEEFDNSNVIELNGSFSIENLLSIPCSFVPARMYVRSDDFYFVNINNHLIQFDTNVQHHWFFSNNGYRILFRTADDIWDYPIGRTSFSETDFLDKIVLRQFIGPFRADQQPIAPAHQWFEFQTKGEFTIDRKFMVNGRQVIEGTIRFTAMGNDGEVIHTVEDMVFRLAR
ncbi:hypothetical protein [Mongoliitalea daihaiensis]|uniref:hypothetical protein n=1 Tax=Mongoliitalea daihaiensis TaxID=2782006 RepID=UPI001F32A8A6|nr:hypothetical protein [Mongoliitalea daihaiensis]UJP65905.1 hypothetical protein IPZ59_04590 [Mongoliitalea daihaiensis]